MFSVTSAQLATAEQGDYCANEERCRKLLDSQPKGYVTNSIFYHFIRHGDQ